MANHRKRGRSATVVVVGATAGMTAILTFGQFADALAARYGTGDRWRDAGAYDVNAPR